MRTMKTKCLSLIFALVVLCQVQVGFAIPVIDQFLILTHPLPWRTLGYQTTDAFPEGAYRAHEDTAYQRWLAAIPSLPQSTFVIQVEYSPTASTNQLLQAFANRLGAGHVLDITGNPVNGKYDPGPLITWYQGIGQNVRQQMTAQGLTFNAATAKGILWGESFEGCGSGDGSGIAYYLGLKTPTTFDFNMSVPDMPFLLNATFLQTVPLPASDVEAYIFNLNDGRSAAFFRSRLTPQWLDHRAIELQLDSDFSVYAKMGTTPIWQGAGGPQSFTLTTWDERFLVTTTPHMAELLSVINGATVVPEPTGLVLLTTGLIALLAYAWQRRK
jgi:hypothetical protein